jgi:hypothetical protein
MRCDSPDLRRYVRMLVSPAPHDGVLFHSQIMRTEPRRIPLRAVSLGGDPAVVMRCSMCNFFRVRGVWTDVIDVVEIGLAMDRDMPVVVAYGICPRCRNLLAQAANDSLRTAGGVAAFTSPLSRPQPSRQRPTAESDGPPEGQTDAHSDSDRAD